MWCVAELDEEYIRRMEELLALYEKPLSEEEPVVCVDEKPVVLHAEVSPPRPMRPGRILQRDSGYKREGTANVFCGVEAKAGRHFTQATPNRSSPQFSDFLVEIASQYHPAVIALAGVDVALIAHGILGDQAAAERDYAAAEANLRTNLLSAISLAGWLADYCEEQRHGVIAVISSVAGDRGRKSNYVYVSSKGGLNVYLDGLRNRVDRPGVRILTVKPGFVDTPITAHLAPSSLFAQPAQVARDILPTIGSHKRVVYVPEFWRWIMVAVRMIPGRIFNRMNF